MILELLVGACVVAAGGAIGEAIRRRRRVWRAGAAAVAGGPPAPSGPRGLRVGDVLVLSDGELWLAGALHLEEDGFVARLFVAPGDPDRWLAQLDPEARELFVLRPTHDLPAGHVAQVMPFAGVRYTVRRRRPVSVRSEGEHVPPPGTRATYTELTAPGGKLLLVIDGTERLVLVGERLLREMADVLPGGDQPAASAASSK